MTYRSRWLWTGLAVLALALVACSVVAGEQTERRARPQAPTPRAVPPTPAAPPEGLILVGSEGDQTVIFVDAASDQVTKTVQLGVPVHGISVDPTGETAWVFSNRPRTSDIYFVDLAKGERAGAKRLRDAPEEPRAVAFSAAGSRAFVALHGASAVSFVDRAKRNEFGRIALGRQSDNVQIRRHPSSVAVVQGPAGGLLYVAGRGSGVVWVLDAGSGALLSEIEIGGGPTLLLDDPATGAVYVLVDTLNRLVALDPSTQRVARQIALPGRAGGAAVGPDGVIYVSGADAAEVWVVPPGGEAVASSIRVGARPMGVAFSAGGGRAYVANSGEDTISVLDVPTQQVVTTIKVGKGPTAVAFAATTGRSPATAAERPAQPAAPTLVPSPTPLPGNFTPEHLPPGVTKEAFVPAAEFPVAMAFAPDGRLFYAELRTGKIRIVENGVLLEEPFYDFTVSGQPEAGLIGLALDPHFAQHPHVYAFYTESANDRDGGPNGPNHIVRLTEVDGKGSDLTPIIPDLPSGHIHNGGSLRFGPDGKLYATLGETGNSSLAQDLASPAGKVLRVNPDGSIPEDNPLAGQSDKHGAIWAYGFRNHFDLDFHPVNGALIVTENGPGDNDELNLVVKGGNYGWPPAGFQDKPDLIDPLAVSDPVISPVGITFYRGEQIPEWRNDFFYCNFHQGQLRRVRLAPETFDRIVFEEIVTAGCTLGVETGPDGALYFSDVDAIYRIRKTDAIALPAVAAGAPSPGATPAPALPEGTRAQDRDVNVGMTEWKLAPSRTVVPAGEIRFVAENLGNTTHALRIVGMESEVDVSTEQFGPGESRALEVELPPGVYEMICPVGNHPALGMVATLTVVGPE